MRLKLTALAFSTALFVAASANAQITGVQATFTQGNAPPDPGVITSGPTGGAYYVGPYTGTIQLGATVIPVQFNCADFFHDVSNGQGWIATLTNLGTGAGVGTTDANSATRLYGNVTVNSQSFSALDVYRAAAYLINTYPSSPSSNAAATIAIQDKIWEATSLFYPQVGGEASDYLNATTRTDGYTYYAPLDAASLATLISNDRNVAGFDYSQYWVVTSSNPSSDLSISPQEFIIHQSITSTPEPGTLVLLGSGLFGVFGVGMTRRRRSSPTDVSTTAA